MDKSIRETSAVFHTQQHETGLSPNPSHLLQSYIYHYQQA